MHLTHIKLKPTIKIKTNSNSSEIIGNIESQKENIEAEKKYKKSKEYDDQDLMMVFNDQIIFAFDFIKDKERYFIPEINPTTIFYSNAVMSHRKLVFFREELLLNSPSIKNLNKPVNPNLFGNYFQLASNCIINLQTTVESFVNRQIPEDKKFLDINGQEFEPSIFHKLDKVLPEIKNRKFKSKFKRDNFRIRKLIELRNEIIHLKPVKEKTNTKYKDVYRRLLKFDFTNSIMSVKKFINFYEPGLIEECDCNKELYYDIVDRIEE